MTPQLGDFRIVESWVNRRDEIVGVEGGRLLVAHPFAAAQFAAIAAGSPTRPDLDVWLERVERAGLTRAIARLDARIAALFRPDTEGESVA